MKPQDLTLDSVLTFDYGVCGTEDPDGWADSVEWDLDAVGAREVEIEQEGDCVSVRFRATIRQALRFESDVDTLFNAWVDETFTAQEWKAGQARLEVLAREAQAEGVDPLPAPRGL